MALMVYGEAGPSNPKTQAAFISQFAIAFGSSIAGGILALLAFTLPTWGGLLLVSESVFHWILLCLAIPISGFAFWYSSQRHQATGTLILG